MVRETEPRWQLQEAIFWPLYRNVRCDSVRVRLGSMFSFIGEHMSTNTLVDVEVHYALLNDEILERGTS